MSRVKIKFPDDNPLFTASILVRIGDINYGNHLGNDAILSIMHEARMQWLRSKGYTEMNAAGNSMIMADVMIAYKNEGFYGDELKVKLYATEVTGKTFDLLYHISALRNGAVIELAHGKTGMACFDYEQRKVASMTNELRDMLS